MARLVSKYNAGNPNIPINFQIKWDTYFDVGSWDIDSTTFSNLSFNGVIWYNNNNVFTNNTAGLNVQSGTTIPLAGVTLKSCEISGLGTQFDLYVGTTKISVGTAILIDATESIYLIRETTTRLSFVKRYDGSAGIANVLSLNSSLQFKAINGSTKDVGISTFARSTSTQTTLRVIKNGSSEPLELYVQPDTDGPDFTVAPSDVIVTDFA